MHLQEGGTICQAYVGSAALACQTKPCGIRACAGVEIA